MMKISECNIVSKSDRVSFLTQSMLQCVNQKIHQALVLGVSKSIIRCDRCKKHIGRGMTYTSINYRGQFRSAISSSGMVKETRVYITQKSNHRDKVLRRSCGGLCQGMSFSVFFLAHQSNY